MADFLSTLEVSIVAVSAAAADLLTGDKDSQKIQRRGTKMLAIFTSVPQSGLEVLIKPHLLCI